MRINHNISSLTSQGALFRVQREMSKSLEKLSTGLRINRASDDAAGLGVSENLRTQVRGIGQALKNNQDVIALLNIAEGGLNEQAAILQRMRELVIQAKNDTYTQTERNYMGEEFDALLEELERIALVTNYNGMQLFADRTTLNTPSSTPHGAINDNVIWDDPSDATLGVNDTGTSHHFNMFIGANYTEDDALAFNPGAQLNSYDKDAENLITIQFAQMDTTALFMKNSKLATADDLLHEFGLGTGAFEMGTVLDPFTFSDIQGKLSTILQIIDGKPVTGQPDLFGMLTGSNPTGLERVNKMRAYIGAMTNRLEHNTNNLLEAEASQQAAESLVRDVDFANETANFTKTQILTQTATSMLAQANVNPIQILRLIR